MSRDDPIVEDDNITRKDQECLGCDKKKPRTMQRYCECNSRLEPLAVFRNGQWTLVYKCSNKNCKPSQETSQLIVDDVTLTYFKRNYEHITGFSYDNNLPLDQYDGSQDNSENDDAVDSDGMIDEERDLNRDNTEKNNIDDVLLPGISALQFGYPDNIYKTFFEGDLPEMTSQDALWRAKGNTKAEMESRKTVVETVNKAGDNKNKGKDDDDSKGKDVSAIIVPRKPSDNNRIQIMNDIMSAVVIDSEFINVEKEEEQNVLTLSEDQKRAICQNDIYDREFKYCEKCKNLCPMVIWQISAKQMKFANICTKCLKIYNLGVTEDKKAN